MHGGQAQVEVRSLSANRSFRANALALAQSVLSGTVADSVPIGPHDLASYEAWDENGWSDSLPFYLATLDHHYEDTTAEYSAVHARVLDQYSRIGTLPTEELPTDVSWRTLERQSTPRATRAEILRRRRTTLVPEKAELAIADFSGVLWESTRKLAAFRTPEIAADPRNAMTNFGPSLDIYVVVYDVSGIAAGLYRYDMKAHALGLLSEGDFRAIMRTVIVGQPATVTAAVSILYVSDVRRHQWRYRHARALRGLWTDTAKVANELLWSLAARGIVPHMTPAIDDTVANEFLEAGGGLEQEVVYVISFGGPRREPPHDRA
jgi:SagB-type dehydrogenase family enzyme